MGKGRTRMDDDGGVDGWGGGHTWFLGGGRNSSEGVVYNANPCQIQGVTV
jgi:hypothetical protein